MGFWTFGGGKKQDGVQQSNGKSGNASQPAKSRGDTSIPGAQSTHSRSDTAKRTTRNRTPSLPQPPRSQTMPALTESKSAQNVRSVGRKKTTGLYQQIPASQGSLGRDNYPEFHGPPTLFAKRADYAAQGRRSKSSNRKAEEYAREREIRAMASSPIPIPQRPTNFRSESPLLREKRQISSGLNRESSEISLPLPGSLADLDFKATQSSFKIGMLAALSPRPNIQYDSQGRTSSGKLAHRGGLAIQKAIEEEDVSDLKRIDELADDLDAGGLRELMERDRKRREQKKESDKAKLLRRLERRAIRDREEETRRARTEAYVRESSPANVERQRGRKTDAAETRSQRSVKASAIQKKTADVGSTVRQSSQDVETTQPETVQQDPFADDQESTKGGAPVITEASTLPLRNDADRSEVPLPVPIRNPFEDEQDMDMTPDFDSGGEVDLSLPIRSPLRPSGSKVGEISIEKQSTTPAPVSPPPRAQHRSSLSQRSFSAFSRGGRSDKAEDSGHGRKKSEPNNVRLSTWTNFFSKGTRRKLGTPTGAIPPDMEFSNTSRESVQRKQLPPVVTDRSFRHSSSGTPQRQLSRFREDLPEIPISTPGSEVQAPDSTTSPVRILDVSQQRIRDDDNDDSYSIQRSIDLGSRPTSITAAILPQSMASVDSEGSWLSGRPSRRVSVPGGTAQTVQRSHSTLQKSVTQESAAQESARNVSTDTHHEPSSSTLADQPSPDFPAHGEAGPSNDIIADRDSRTPSPPALPPKSVKRESFHADARRRPTLVDQGQRVPSHAGLLNDAKAGDDSNREPDEDKPDELATTETNEDTPRKTVQTGSAEETAEEEDVESPGSMEIIDGPLLRAQSVEYKGHARAVSAGSAKLLEIRRSSTHSDLSRPRSPTVARKSALGVSQQDDSSPGTPATID